MCNRPGILKRPPFFQRGDGGYPGVLTRPPLYNAWPPTIFFFTVFSWRTLLLEPKKLWLSFSPPLTYKLVTQKKLYYQGLTRLKHWASKFNKWRVQNPQWQNLGGGAACHYHEFDWPLRLFVCSPFLSEKVIFGAKNAQRQCSLEKM